MVLKVALIICMTIGVFYTLVFYIAVFFALKAWIDEDNRDHNGRNRRNY